MLSARLAGAPLGVASSARRACISTTAVCALGKRDLIKAVSEKANLSVASAETAVNSVLDTIVNTVAEGDKVVIPGFGSFEARHRPARAGRNPRTGEALSIAASTTPAFAAGKTFKEAVKAGKAPAP